MISLKFSSALLLQVCLHSRILPNPLPLLFLIRLPPFISLLGNLLLHSLLIFLHISLQGSSRFSFPSFFLVSLAFFLKFWFLACPAEGVDDLGSRELVLSQFEFPSLFHHLQEHLMDVVAHFKEYLGFLFLLKSQGSQGSLGISIPSFFLVSLAFFLKSWFLACPPEWVDDLELRDIVLSQFEFPSLFRHLEEHLMDVVAHFKEYLWFLLKSLADTMCPTIRREIRKSLLLTITPQICINTAGFLEVNWM